MWLCFVAAAGKTDDMYRLAVWCLRSCAVVCYLLCLVSLAHFPGFSASRFLSHSHSLSLSFSHSFCCCFFCCCCTIRCQLACNIDIHVYCVMAALHTGLQVTGAVPPTATLSRQCSILSLMDHKSRKGPWWPFLQTVPNEMPKSFKSKPLKTVLISKLWQKNWPKKCSDAPAILSSDNPDFSTGYPKFQIASSKDCRKRQSGSSWYMHRALLHIATGSLLHCIASKSNNFVPTPSNFELLISQQVITGHKKVFLIIL